MAATGAFELPEDLLQQAVRVSRRRTSQGCPHRGVKIPDLLIAAAAYDLISSITGQDTAWVVEKGSVS
jgi:predicted nucleic acid-binding protein